MGGLAVGVSFSVSESEIGLCSESNMGHTVSKMGTRAGSKYMDGDKPAPPRSSLPLPIIRPDPK